MSCSLARIPWSCAWSATGPGAAYCRKAYSSPAGLATGDLVSVTGTVPVRVLCGQAAGN